jgi:ABC-type branched-subunit amino acid transport system ATPase component
MTFVSTTIMTPDNKLMVVPNNSIWGNIITNVTGSHIRRVDLIFGIGYSDDIDKAQKVLESILNSHDLILDEPAPEVHVHELGDSSVNFVGLQDAPDRVAGLLSHGQKQWLEIGMLLMQEPKLLLLDEPVAGMSDQETERTAELFLSLAGTHSLVVVEHDMAFIASIARKVTVLHEGCVLAEGPMDQVQSDPRVIEVYLGR